MTGRSYVSALVAVLFIWLGACYLLFTTFAPPRCTELPAYESTRTEGAYVTEVCSL